MKELVEHMAKALVDDPDSVAVTEKEDGVIELKVATGDMGRVIGKSGRTARSIRTILGAAATKAHKKITLDIVE